MSQPQSSSIKQLEKDIHRLFFGLGSTFSLSSSGTSSSPSTNLGRSVSPQLTLPASVRPDQNAVMSDKTTERSASSLVWSDKEVGHHFTDTQRDQNPTFNTVRNSYSISSTSQGLKRTYVDSSAIDWSPICRRDSKEDTSKLYSFGVQSIPGLDLDEIPVSNRSTLPSGTGPPRFTAESAESILLNFGLEKEDLVDLAAYPEDEITPDTLPLILHQIHIQKQKRAAGNSSQLHPTTSMTFKNSLDSETTVKKQEKMPKSILKPSKVFEYEHSDKFVIAKDEIGKTSRDCGVVGATLLSDKQKPSGCSKKSLLKSETQVKSSKSDSVTSLSSKRNSVIHPGRDPTKQIQTKPKREIKNTKPPMSKASKNNRLKEPEPGCLSASKNKKICSKRPNSLDLKNSNSEKSKTQEKRKTVGEERKHQQTKQNCVQQKAKILGKHEESKMVKLSSESSQQFVVKKQLLPTPTTTHVHRLPFSPSSHQHLFKGTLSNGLPTPSIVNDYTGATPRTFPHTCCLCNKKCAHMQDWLSHQKTDIHLEKRRLFHKHAQRTKPLLSTSQTSQHRHQETRRESRSWSRSPHRSHSSDGRRDNSRSSFCSNIPHHQSSSSHSHQHSKGPHHSLKGQSQKSRSESQSSSPCHLRGSKDRRDSSRSRSPHTDAQGSNRRKHLICDDRRIANDEEVDEVQSIPGLGEIPVSNRSTLPSGTSPPRFTAESAENILLDFGLEKEDLVDLATYPEDEITPDTLPFILRQIRIQKQKRAAENASELVSLQNSLNSSVGPAVNQHKMPKSILKPSKVIDYEHLDKFAINKDEIGKTSRDHSVGGATLLSDKQKPSGCSKKSLLKSVIQVKSSKSDSVTSLRRKKGSVIHPGRDPTKQIQTKGKIKNTKPLKSKASKNHRLKEPEKSLKSSNCEKRKREMLCKERKHQQMKQNYVHCKATKHTKGMIDVEYLDSSTEEAPLYPFAAPLHHYPFAVTSPSVPLLPTQSLRDIHRLNFSPSSQQPVSKGTLSNRLPTTSMVNDYAATTPRVFPHTCCLCNKECAHMQDWLSHQNTSFHLESCRLLRKHFPEWDGEVLQFLGTNERSPSPHQTSQSHHQKTRSSSRSSSPWRYDSSRSPSYSYRPDSYHGLKEWHRSRSRSPSTSPHHHRGSKDRRDRRSSRSRSPHSFRDTHRSRSPLYDQPTSSHYRSRSRSHERRSSFSRRDEEWSSLRRNYGRQFSPKRNDEKRTSPGRSHERRLSTEKSVPQRRSSSSTERLTKKLLETSAVQSLLNRSDLEVLVKTLTPVILAEIDKMSSTSSSSSSNDAEELKAAAITPETEPGLQKSKDCVSMQSASASATDQNKPQQKSAESIVSIPENVTLMASGTSEAPLSSSSGDKITTADTRRVMAGRLIGEKRPRTSLRILTPEANTPSPAEAKNDSEYQLDAAEEQISAAEEPVLLNTRLERTGEVENMETGSTSQGKGEKWTGASIHPPTSTDKTTSEKSDPPQSLQTVSKTPENSAESPCEVQSKLQQTAEPSAGAASKDSVTAEKTKEKMASNSVSDVSAESAQEAESSSTELKPKWNPVDHYHLDPVTSMTVGDTVEKYLEIQSLRLFHHKCSSLQAKRRVHLLLISELPCFPNDCYTEEEVASLLYPFGFKYAVDTIYVIPQTGMAFALMPSSAALKNVVREAWDGIPFKGRTLCLRPVNNFIAMTPFGFYKSLMKLMHFNVTDYGTRTVFFHNISPSEVGELRKILIKNFPVRNFLPLLNKLFVEFESSDDVDLLGLSYSQLQAQTYTMLRLEDPQTLNKSYAHSDLPQKTCPPFWVTMKTVPYIFPTARPWFHIPRFTTTREVLKTNLRDTWFSGVMLTGLPKFAYKHQTVVNLVWPHVPAENNQSLNSNLIVLPLQRRAFVFFSSQFSALGFLKRNHNGVFVFRKVKIGIHPLLEMTHPGPSDVMVYRDMMKWSNCEVYDSDFLEDRLLYVETFQASFNFMKWFMKMVASITPFVNFLPLGDRIYIEMSDSRALIHVVGQLSSGNNLFPSENWKNIGYIGPCPAPAKSV